MTEFRRVLFRSLRPLRRSRAGQVRSQLAALGIVEADVAAAVDWARNADE